MRTIASGGADFGFADIATMIVARSRGTPVQAAAQFGYVGATIVWRDEGVIKVIKDLEGKSLAISPGQAQWFLMPAYRTHQQDRFQVDQDPRNRGADSAGGVGDQEGRFHHHVSRLQR